MFIAELSTVAKLWKQPRCPSADEGNRRCGIMEYYSAIKKNEIMPFATIWMDLVGPTE